jgi:hypothetical protein
MLSDWVLRSDWIVSKFHQCPKRAKTKRNADLKHTPKRSNHKPTNKHGNQQKATKRKNAYEPYAGGQKAKRLLKSLTDKSHNNKLLNWWLTVKCAVLT